MSRPDPTKTDEMAVEWLRCALGLAADETPFPRQLDLLRRFLRGDVVSALDNDDPLLRASRRFASIADYVVTRHAKRLTAADAVIADVRRECERRRISAPDVGVTGLRGVAGLGVVARVELTFARAVLGPLLLGRTRYFGGGLFEPVGD